MTEAVNHPQHYGGDNLYEAIKVIEAWELGFHLGNAVKYIARAGKKSSDPFEDIEKAVWYLNRYLSRLETDEILADPETMVAIREAQEAKGWVRPTPLEDLPVRLETWSSRTSNNGSADYAFAPAAENAWDDQSMITVRYLRTGEDDPYPQATWTEYVTGDEFTENISARAAGYFGRGSAEQFGLKVPGYANPVEEGIQLKDFAKPGDVLFLVER